MDTNDDFQADQVLGLETLAKQINKNLKRWSCCVLFEDQLQRYWPDSDRESRIQAFAESHGWIAFIHKGDLDDTRAIFLPE